MNNEVLQIVLPEVFDEKQAKELKSSFTNMLQEYFKAFSDMADSINKKYPSYRFGTVLSFDKLDYVFEILFVKNLRGSKIIAGMIEQQTGCISTTLSYDQALIINKYAYEMAMKIHSQKVEVIRNGFTETKKIGGIYSVPSSAKTPIYRSMDSKLNFPESNDTVTFVRNKGR